MKPRILLFVGLVLAMPLMAADNRKITGTLPGDKMAADYFAAETAKLGKRCLADIQTLEDWKAQRDEFRRQATEMLGLSPMPEHTDLKAVVTGKIEKDDFVVEKLHFQSLPGLYVTANLYRPRQQTKPLPAVLYVCGHGEVVTNGISCGNKTSYQHHGIWFARNGYVCLVIDTVQLGEIRGLHHGTYRMGMWWWNSRGYSPSAVEAWDGIRALDYLCARPEVDASRLGITGRSGGGSYSWTVAALDERVKAIAPAAGITDLQNYVVDGAIEGHCDCMFMVNTYRWDYPLLAALCAPRPLLLVNTDADTIFPLDGVMRTHSQVKKIYAMHQAETNFGLVIGPGPHKDTQNLQIPVFRWFNTHLKGEDSVIEMAAVKMFHPLDLRVFETIPADQLNTNIQSLFGQMAAAPVIPANKGEWQKEKEAKLKLLRMKCFAAWPETPEALQVAPVFALRVGKVLCDAYEFNSQPEVRLRFYVVRKNEKTDRMIMHIGSGARLSPTNQLGGVEDRQLNEVIGSFEFNSVEELSAAVPNDAMLVSFIPRHLGLTAWSGDAKKQTHLRRRFMLLGTTLDAMRVWDIRRAMQAVRSLPGSAARNLSLHSQDAMGVNTLYAAMFEPAVKELLLARIPATHLKGPDYLNVLKVMDLPEAVALVAENTPITLQKVTAADWDYPVKVAKVLNWPAEQVRVREGN
jgi:dienelactone hydrolase